MGPKDCLTEDEVCTNLSKVPGWERVDVAIVREFEFSGFQEAFGFLTRVALITEVLDHHAEIWNVWNRVKLTFSTHDAGGLTEKDFEAARQINAIV